MKTLQKTTKGDRLLLFKELRQCLLVLCSSMLVFFISSCSSMENSEISPTPSTPVVANPERLAIDSTDLKNLPMDEGGTQTAFPLGKTDAVFGHFVYTPSGYSEDGPAYPLLVFLHGWDPTEYTGSDESELNELLQQTTPPGLIHTNRWNPSFPFIVASPRLKSLPYWSDDKIHEFIDYVIDAYQVNTKRIYVTGLSLGGGGAWYYAGLKGDESHAAAIVPISASGAEYLTSNLAKIPVWAFHGDMDETVQPYENYASYIMVDAINKTNPPVQARMTMYKNTGHNAWSKTYRDQFTENAWGTPFNVSIYDWMLQYKKE